MNPVSFELWMKHVDDWCWRLIGVSVYDLPDCPFTIWWRAGTAPRDAAQQAIDRAW